MRHILLKHARARNAQKRGGGARGVVLSETAAIWEDRHVELLDLGTRTPRQAERLARGLDRYAGVPVRCGEGVGTEEKNHLLVEGSTPPPGYDRKGAV